MFTKRRSKKKKVVTVTFTLPAQIASQNVRLAGDFTSWEPSCEFRRLKDGRWRAAVELEPGREYQFRYLADGQHWLNDPAADRYVRNPYGEDNSIICT